MGNITVVPSLDYNKRIKMFSQLSTCFLTFIAIVLNRIIVALKKMIKDLSNKSQETTGNTKKNYE